MNAPDTPSSAPLHPMETLAQRLDGICHAHDPSSLSRLLRGYDLPTISREGDEPAEIIWQCILRWRQPPVDWLNTFSCILAELLEQDFEHAQRKAQPPTETYYFYNLVLLAYQLPPNEHLFEALCRWQSSDLVPALDVQIPALFRAALIGQQTDTRLLTQWEQQWAQEIKVLNKDNLVEAQELWRALLLALCTTEEQLPNTDCLSHNLDALYQDKIPNHEVVHYLLEWALRELQVVFTWDATIWRNFFIHSQWYPLLQDYAQDIWPDDAAPDFYLPASVHHFWQQIGITQRQRIRTICHQNAYADWQALLFELNQHFLAKREHIKALRQIIEKNHPALKNAPKDPVAAIVTEAIEEEAEAIKPKTFAPKPLEQFEKVLQQLKHIESEIAQGRAIQARRWTQDLLAQQKKWGTTDELIVKSASNIANMFLQHHYLSEAEALYRTTIQDFPMDVVARNGLAEVLKARGELSEAEVLYRTTITDFPMDVVARCGLADVLKARGELSEAEVLYRTTIKDFPMDVVARCGLADVLKARGELSEAEVLYRTTIKDFPMDVVARCGLADVLKARGELSEAEALYRTTIQDFPMNVVARNGLAEVLKARGELSEAEALYRTTIQDFPMNVVARNGLAEVLKARGELSEAEALYRTTITDFPMDVVAKNGLANILRKQQKFTEALQILDQIQTKDPIQTGYDSAVRALILSKQGHHQAAQEVLQEGLAQMPDSLARQQLAALLVHVQVYGNNLALAKKQWRPEQASAQYAFITPYLDLAVLQSQHQPVQAVLDKLEQNTASTSQQVKTFIQNLIAVCQRGESICANNDLFELGNDLLMVA